MEESGFFFDYFSAGGSYRGLQKNYSICQKLDCSLDKTVSVLHFVITTVEHLLNKQLEA